MAKMICRSCGARGEFETRTQGSAFIAFVLLLFFVIPGLIYILWMFTSAKKTCSKCKSIDVIPLNSPMGQKLAQELPEPERTDTLYLTEKKKNESIKK